MLEYSGRFEKICLCDEFPGICTVILSASHVEFLFVVKSGNITLVHNNDNDNGDADYNVIYDNDDDYYDCGISNKEK